MFDLLTEQRISLTDLAKREDVNCSTAWRWASRGVNGIRLETYSRGGRRFTTLPAFSRWVQRVSVARGGTDTQPQTNRQRVASINAATSELRAAGI